MHPVELRRAMTHLGLKKEGLAHFLDVSPSTVHNWLSLQDSRPMLIPEGYARLIRFLIATGFTFEDVMRAQGMPIPDKRLPRPDFDPRRG